MSPDDLTADWFSSIFGTEVRGIEHEPIGDGLVGMNLRVSIDAVDAEHGAPTAPSSVVVKLPSADPTSRATGVALRNYEREVKFYGELAGSVDIRVPACFHGEWHEDTGDFVLVLEDMAPARQGDQLSGCSPELAETTVRELAKLHGPRWGDPTLDGIEWLSRRTEGDAEQLVGLWDMMYPGFEQTYRSHLTDEQAALVRGFGPRIPSWLGARTEPTTVTHGDFRLDNLLFGQPNEGSPAVCAVDWQTPGQGVGVADLSYFIGAGLLPGDRREHERALVEAYADGLAAYDVHVDPIELFDGYRRESFAGVIMAVIASQVVGSSDRSESMFAAMASRHLQQALDLQAVDLIPNG